MPEDFLAAPAFSDFNELTEDRHYAAIPGDWTVFVADIADSTKAIESGRYKDVNMLGAACIVAAQNALPESTFPYTFGGDGATLLVPPEGADRVAAALAGVRALARDYFAMTLRVGAVKAGELAAAGRCIEVARFRLAASRSVALFRGGGVSRADELIKNSPEKYFLPETLQGGSDLEGLSCRWQPIPSRRGIILSILVQALAPNPQAEYRALLKALDEILDGDSRSACPVHAENMSYRSLPRLLDDEASLHLHVFSWKYLSRAAEIALSVLAFKFSVSPWFDAKRYADSLPAHADFRKFDDMLRMVLDCTTQQAGRIRRELERLRERGDVRYGLHESDSALMTCFVNGVEDGQHIHFIDGSGGGYAMAAKQYKAQIRA